MSWSNFITTRYMDNIVAVPMAQPQVRLRQADSLVISTLSLVLGQRAKLSWLSLQLLQLYNVDPAITPTKIDTGFGLVYTGVYSGSIIDRPAGRPTNLISLETPSIANLGSRMANEFYGPQIVSVVVANNLSNIDVGISLVGCWQVFLVG